MCFIRLKTMRFMRDVQVASANVALHLLFQFSVVCVVCLVVHNQLVVNEVEAVGSEMIHSNVDAAQKYYLFSVFIIYCVFFQEFSKVCHLSFASTIGCTKNDQPIGVTVHSHCVESFEGL